MLRFIRRWLDSSMCVTWLIHVRDMAPSYMCDMAFWYMCDTSHRYTWRGSFIWVICIVAWLFHIFATHSIDARDMAHSYVWYDLAWLIHICVTHFIDACDVAHSCVWCVSWHGSFIYVWHTSSMCDTLDRCVTHFIYVCHISSMHVTWLIHTCDMTHPCVWVDLFKCAIWLLHMCDVT